MFDKLKYISSTNKVIEFGGKCILINQNNIRNYEWRYSQEFKRISSFNRNPVTKTLPVLLYNTDDIDVKTMANNIFDIVEEDVLRQKYGRLYSGDYYMQGYFISSSKTNYTADGFLKFNLGFLTDRPYWIGEITYHYAPNDVQENEDSQEWLDYPHDYPYDYRSSFNASNIINPSFIDQNMRIRIYGACVDPSVIIDEHIYHLDTTILADEYVTIDTTEKTIIKTLDDGTTENIFNSRGLDYYIFQKIPSGEHTMMIIPDTAVDLTIFEERSEPKW